MEIGILSRRNVSPRPFGSSNSPRRMRARKLSTPVMVEFHKDTERLLFGDTPKLMPKSPLSTSLLKYQIWHLLLYTLRKTDRCRISISCPFIFRTEGHTFISNRNSTEDKLTR